jgi:putative photosynthetic complex assembly protein
MTTLSTPASQWLRFALLAVLAPLGVVAGIHAMRPLETEPAPAIVIPKATVIETRDLRFLPAGGTALFVVDHKTGEQLKHATEETASFMTTLLKGLVFERRRRELDQGAPYRLTRWSDGRLSLVDLNTEQHIELVAFGRTNAATFASLLANEKHGVLTQGKLAP